MERCNEPGCDSFVVDGKCLNPCCGNRLRANSVVDQLQKRLEQALSGFYNEKLTPEIFQRVKSVVLEILHSAVAEGLIASRKRLPLVDINNMQERVWLGKQIEELDLQRPDRLKPYCTSDPLDKELWEKVERLTSIIREDKARNPSALDVALKDPDTLKPFSFEPSWYEEQ